jgi:transcriptional regulator with XRE-family HTH domain
MNIIFDNAASLNASFLSSFFLKTPQNWLLFYITLIYFYNSDFLTHCHHFTIKISYSVDDRLHGMVYFFIKGGVNMSNLGKFIEEHRMAKHLSARKLAELAKISHTEIHRLETGERKHPSPLILKSIAHALDVSFDEIMVAADYIEDTSHSALVPMIISGVHDLNEKELEEVLDFINFLRSKRSKNEEGNKEV